MSDFEDRIRADMRIDLAAPDEAFVSKIAAGVEADGRRRALWLAFASVLATGLVGAMAACIAGLWPMFVGLLPQDIPLVPGEAFSLLGSAGAAIGVLVVAALLAPLAQLRR